MDILNSSRLLFSDGLSIKYSDGKISQSLFGNSDKSGYAEGRGFSAKFKSITDFMQTNMTHIIAVDQMNNCLRILVRATQSTAQFSGRCSKKGFANGAGPVALFNEPTAAARMKWNVSSIVVTDKGNNAIRLVHLITTLVSTIFQGNPLVAPMAIAFNVNCDAMLIGCEYYIVELSLTTINRRIISGSNETGDADGSLADARFGAFGSLLVLSPSLILVTDSLNGNLRLIDIANDKVSPLCPTRSPFDCNVDHPFGLLLTMNRLFVGSLSGTHMWSGMYVAAKMNYFNIKK